MERRQKHYQKQVSGLPALPRDLHECALFDKHLPKETAHVHKKHVRLSNCCLHQLCFWPWEGLKKQMSLRNNVLWQWNGDTGQDAHPAGLQEVPLALHAVLYVDQTQQVLLREQREHRDGGRLTSDGRRRRRRMKLSPVCSWMKGREAERDVILKTEWGGWQR